MNELQTLMILGVAPGVRGRAIRCKSSFYSGLSTSIPHAAKEKLVLAYNTKLCFVPISCRDEILAAVMCRVAPDFLFFYNFAA